MNCEQYLSKLSVASIDELLEDDPDSHAASCAQCDRITRLVVERESNLVAAYNGTYSHVPASFTAGVARGQATSTYRSRFSWMGWSVALLAVVWVVASRVFLTGGASAPGPDVPLSKEVFLLRCLSSQQAGELARGILEANGSAVMRLTADGPVLTARGTPEQLNRLRSVFDEYEHGPHALCTARVEPVSPAVPAPPPG